MPETVLLRYVSILAQTLEREYGIAAEKLYQTAGISLNEGPDRIPEKEAEALWVAADRFATDGLIGLHVGKSVRYGSYASLGHLLVTSDTVGDALRAACDYALYVGAAGRFELIEAEDEARLVYSPIRPNWLAGEVRSEAVLLPFARFARWASPGVAPVRVYLMRSKPSNAAAFEEAFGAPVVFDADVHAMTWPREALMRPMNDANPALHAMLKEHVRAEMPALAGVTSQLEHYFKERLGEGGHPTGLTIGDAADGLNMSVRSLQRELEQAGESFRGQLAKAREGEARRLLTQKNVSVQVVSALLGYSEPAAFIRAFGRWTGMSPAEYRREHGR
ncbi:AraC family transcriptional regulator ligand-binding domain-containing protein [Kordiimonas sp.]|uniref:AraC family transcriptional regulator n=1 Tax=Kordiimonas sp. TaxID=1970157 RepID=UPI003A8CC789